MKKTLITLAVMSGLAVAGDEITLLYGMDFNTIGSGGLQYTNIAENPGIGSITKVGSNYANYIGTDATMDGSYGYANLNSPNYYFKIANSVDGGDLGVNTTDGFTLVYNTKFSSNDDWSSSLTFNIGGQDMVFHWGTSNNTSMNIYTSGDGGAVATNNNGENAAMQVGNMVNTAWYNVALTAKNGSITLTVLNSDGTVVGSTTNVAKYTGALQSVTGYTSYKQGNPLHIDNLAIYDDALSQNQLVALTNYEMTNKTLMQTIAVPEPTTATLSLLALAGLAARRRRK